MLLCYCVTAAVAAWRKAPRVSLWPMLHLQARLAGMRTVIVAGLLL
jgi:hypothetical protein